ncbi:hypothetical protein AU954_07770 [Salmonella enterica subsp. enterica serovar Enteritidis]|nr:hypothetical protein [Salmonella enterica subsp. enterica serovar Enteritidis]
MEPDMNNVLERESTVSTVIICAVNNIMRTALKQISVPAGKRKSRVICLSCLSDLIQTVEQQRPDCIIIDAAPRQCLFLLFTLRCRFGCLPVIFTRKTFLFSDRIATEFFGSVLLRDYDALMNAFPQSRLSNLPSNQAFAGPEYSGSAPVYKLTPGINISEDTLVLILNIWLQFRLLGIISSVTGRKIIMSCLIDGMSVEKMAERMQVSDKSIYYHRSKIMKKFGIRRSSDEFIMSFRFFKDAYHETTTRPAISLRG